MEKTLSQLVKDIHRTYQEYLTFQSQKPTRYQNRNLRIKYLNDKIRFLKKKITKMVNKPGSRVKFKLGDRLFEAILPSLNKEDAVTYLELISLMRGLKLEILEISEINSEIRNLNL